MLCEAAHHASRPTHPLHPYFALLCAKRGYKMATIAVAHRLHVRVFNSYEGWGYRFLASGDPIPELSATSLAARLPARAAADLVEWGPHSTPEEFFEAVLRREIRLQEIIEGIPDVPTLQDDRPVNEYYLLRAFRR
jgi:hypothetical protein